MRGSAAPTPFSPASIFADPTLRKQVEERARLLAHFDALTGPPNLVTDRKGCIVKVNPAFTRTTGYTAEEALGRTPKMLQSGQHDEAFYAAFWNALATQGQWQGDIWNRRKNGEVYPKWLNVSSVRDARGDIEHYIAIFSDITERKRQEAVITYQAYHDSLTGLPNRILFRDRLEQALAAAGRQLGGRHVPRPRPLQVRQRQPGP